MKKVYRIKIDGERKKPRKLQTNTFLNWIKKLFKHK